jgi:hypothetical protein
LLRSKLPQLTPVPDQFGDGFVAPWGRLWQRQQPLNELGTTVFELERLSQLLELRRRHIGEFPLELLLIILLRGVYVQLLQQRNQSTTFTLRRPEYGASQSLPFRCAKGNLAPDSGSERRVQMKPVYELRASDARVAIRQERRLL